ncbi:MAG: Proprotein convertase, partial [Caulobacteraceae bacterium]|nr:Proprotein convertase [Caulobacteraceae bacterium]
MSTINGTPDGETLTGTTGDDSIYAGAGGDTLYGGDGNDLLEPGLGDDHVYGGNGAADIVSYADAPSGVTVSLAITSAQNTGGEGADTLVGVEGVTGSAYDDVLTGLTNQMAGSDYLRGGDGDDIIYGGTASNSIFGGTGTNHLYGGSGQDIFYTGFGIDLIYGGSGANDLVDLRSADVAITANLATGVFDGGPGVSGTLSGIENIAGGHQNNVLIGDDHANGFDGGLGDDVVYGGGGDDVIVGGDGSIAQGGSDTFYGGDGNDEFIFHAGGVQQVYGGDGADWVFVGGNYALHVDLGSTAAQDDGHGGSFTLHSVEGFIGSFGDDVIIGTDADNLIGAGDGNDYLVGG